MNSRVWFARFLFYLLVHFRGQAPTGGQEKATARPQPKAAPLGHLTPAQQAK